MKNMKDLNYITTLQFLKTVLCIAILVFGLCLLYENSLWNIRHKIEGFLKHLSFKYKAAKYSRKDFTKKYLLPLYEAVLYRLKEK